METKESPNAAEIKAAVKYWSRTNRCPWRANGNAFYTRALRYLKHGHEPQSLPKRQRRTFDNWMSEGFEWSEKHQHIILKTEEPFPSQVSLQRQERTFIVLSGAKEAAQKVENAYKVHKVGMSGAGRGPFGGRASIADRAGRIGPVP